MTTDIQYSEEIERQLAVLRTDHAKVEGYPFKHFLCPILLRDERVPLCLGHIINEAIPNSFRGTVVQRQDVDNFYGSRFEADFTTRMQAMGMDPSDILADPAMSRRMQQRILVNGEEWPHYPDQEDVPHGHTRIELNIGKAKPLKRIIKKAPEEVEALQHFGFELAIGRDCRLPFLVSTIKAAYLTLFKLMGYNYALCAAGIAIGVQLLGRVYREFAGKDIREVRQSAANHFVDHVNMVRPIERFTGQEPLGTIQDRRARLCRLSSGKFFGMIVCLRANDQFFAVMMPMFTEPDGAVAYFNFMHNDRTTLVTHTCQLDADRILVSKEQREAYWPKGDVTITLD